MPQFGSGNYSPSLQKMDKGKNRFRGNAFNFANIAGDPFWLGTIGIAISGWLIAFISSILANAKTGFPNYAWWTLVYTLLNMIAIIYVVGTDCVFTYHVAICGFSSAGLVMTTSATNSLIYFNFSPEEAAAAGFILLAIVDIFWIFYFGAQPAAAHRQGLESLAMHRDTDQSRISRGMRQSQRPDTTISNNNAPQMYNSAQLAGFETSSPVTGYAGGPTGAADRHSTAEMFAQPPQQNGLSNGDMRNTSVGAAGAPLMQDNSVSQPVDYPYRAKAIYSYDANPDDANEISFLKNDILDVSDVSGRWWQAKKSNGETGIAPSNYLILL